MGTVPAPLVVVVPVVAAPVVAPVVGRICSAKHCKEFDEMQEQNEEGGQVSCKLRRDPDDGGSFNLTNQVAHNLLNLNVLSGCTRQNN